MGSEALRRRRCSHAADLETPATRQTRASGSLHDHINVSAAERKIYSVGKPVWGVDVQIWDDHQRPLPAGRDHVGEIVIRGVNMMRGCFGNPEATAEAFAGGWFHTGDLGFCDEDGYYFIVDRIKDLIIRGG